MTAIVKRVQIDLPEPLYQALVTYQQQQAIESPSLAARKILERGLQSDVSTPAYASQERLDQLEGKVNRLFEWVTQLRQDAKVAPTAPAPHPAERQDPPVITTASSLYLEEADDEPDEILWDFIEPGTEG